MRCPQKSIKFDPFPVRYLKDASWKVTTDEKTHSLQSHLKFPGILNQWLEFKGCPDTRLISLWKSIILSISSDGLLMEKKSTLSQFRFSLVVLITCPVLPAPSNGVKLGCPRNITYYGTECHFLCKYGYAGSGSEARRCQRNGTWTGQEFACHSRFPSSCLYRYKVYEHLLLESNAPCPIDDLGRRISLRSSIVFLKVGCDCRLQQLM